MKLKEINVIKTALAIWLLMAIALTMKSCYDYEAPQPIQYEMNEGEEYAL